jgi:hypothetical protein
MAQFPKYSQGRHERTQVLDFTSVSAGATSAFASQTYIVRLAATAPAHYKIYDPVTTSTATSASPILHIGMVEYVGVAPGQRITAIKAGGGSITSADGRMTITEIS